MHFSKTVRVYTVNGKYMCVFASSIAALLQDLQSLSVSVSLKNKGRKQGKKEKKKNERIRVRSENTRVPPVSASIAT